MQNPNSSATMGIFSKSLNINGWYSDIGFAYFLIQQNTMYVTKQTKTATKTVIEVALEPLVKKAYAEQWHANLDSLTNVVKIICIIKGW